MTAQAQPKFFRAPAPAPRQPVFLRAVVGSLVLCAALAPTAVQAQEATQPPSERTELHSISFDPRPFRELLAKVADLHANGLLDFKDTFEITVEAERDSDGTLQDIDIATTATTNNERWRELAQEFVGAVSDSRALAGVEDARHLSLKFQLTPESVSASAVFEAASAQRAQSLAHNYGLLLKAACFKGQDGDEDVVLKGMTATANGKQLVMKLEMSRQQAGNLLCQHLSLP